MAVEELRDHLFVGRAERHPAFAPVGELEEHVAHHLLASGLLPQLDRLDHGEVDLLGAGGVHLLADDVLDLALDAPAEREVRVDAGHELIDEAATEQQGVAGRLGIAGCFTQGVSEAARHSHGASLGWPRSGEQ